VVTNIRSEKTTSLEKDAHQIDTALSFDQQVLHGQFWGTG
jgi:hypothetical protein